MLESSAEVTLQNARGLHARASARFVECVNGFDAVVSVTKDCETVVADSIMELLMLGAPVGTTLTLRAEGVEAEAVIAALVELINDRFGEEQ